MLWSAPFASLPATPRLIEVVKERNSAEKKKCKAYLIGYFHLDIAEVQTEEGKLSLFFGIDRTSTFAYAELHTEATRVTAKSFLEQLILSVPFY